MIASVKSGPVSPAPLRLWRPAARSLRLPRGPPRPSRSRPWSRRTGRRLRPQSQSVRRGFGRGDRSWRDDDGLPWDNRSRSPTLRRPTVAASGAGGPFQRGRLPGVCQRGSKGGCRSRSFVRRTAGPSWRAMRTAVLAADEAGGCYRSRATTSNPAAGCRAPMCRMGRRCRQASGWAWRQTCTVPVPPQARSGVPAGAAGRDPRCPAKSWSGTGAR
jgi:hypothetical protein